MVSSVVLSYVDPAAGALVLQAIVAVFLTVGLFFRKTLFAPFAFVLRTFNILLRPKNSDIGNAEDEQ